MSQPAVVYSVVIPAHREGAALRASVPAIADVLESLAESYEIVLVDDGSNDDTWSIICHLSRDRPSIKAARLSRNFGKEAALAAGLQLTSGAAIIVMDADLQHPPALITEMARLWREVRFEVVEAVKMQRPSESAVIRTGAALFYTLISGLSGYDLRGATDFKLLDRRVVDAWLSMPERTLFFRGMTAWLGFRRAQIPFKVPPREHGTTKWSLLKLTVLALTAVTAFSSSPLRLVSVVGATFATFAGLLGMHTLYMKMSGHAVTGFVTVILLLLVIGSALLLGMGIIGEYLARIYEEVKGRPRYIVAETITGAAQREHGEIERPDTKHE